MFKESIIYIIKLIENSVTLATARLMIAHRVVRANSENLDFVNLDVSIFL